jgi:hypothetical protein
MSWRCDAPPGQSLKSQNAMRCNAIERFVMATKFGILAGATAKLVELPVQSFWNAGTSFMNSAAERLNLLAPLRTLMPLLLKVSECVSESVSENVSE